MTLATDTQQCSEATARALTDQLRQSLTIAWDLLVEAYQRRAWAALGYQSWDAYTDAELGETRLRLPREERREVVASMTEAGMSARAISSALGVSKNTVTEDRQQVSQIGTPDEPVDAEIVDERDPWPPTVNTLDLDDDGRPAGADPIGAKIAAELAAADSRYAEQAAPARVLGTDGKTYPAPKPPEPSPAVTAWLDSSQDVQNSGYLREFFKTFARADDFLQFTAERLGPLIDQGEFESLEMYAVSVSRFVDTVRRSRTGLRVINGGN